jgi:hypothetical protein
LIAGAASALGDNNAAESVETNSIDILQQMDADGGTLAPE